MIGRIRRIIHRQPLWTRIDWTMDGSARAHRQWRETLYEITRQDGSTSYSVKIGKGSENLLALPPYVQPCLSYYRAWEWYCAKPLE